ncbi:MAG: glycosyltransferase family 2 protein [Armatimonadetes bacterium]|jgi:cellulose synthase/poly-beta-1,6-N-acetylglucosamine synthase-like glycosyltransferase|nr:glycosyltransferase family 2 protein [Armatimonadota bacterium]
MLLATVLFWASWALIIYTYGVFPVLLAMLAARRRKQFPPVMDLPDEELPRIAMVVSAYNEARYLPSKLENTRRIDYPADRFEMVLGSDGSSDGTVEQMRQADLPFLKAFPFEERRGKVSVLNDLIHRTDAEIVVMSDANTMFAPDAVRKLVRHFREPHVGCVSGELSLEQDGGVSGEGLYWRYEGWIKRNENRLGFLVGCNGGIFAMRRELYEALPANTLVEDFVMTLRLVERGYCVRFEPEAKATEPPCPTARAEMMRKTRIGAGGFQALGLTSGLLHPKHGVRAFAYTGHKVLRWFVPHFLMVALAANCALAGEPFYRGLLVLQLAGALVAGWAYNARPGTNLPRWTRPVSYFYLMNYALLCGFIRFLFRTQRVTWDRLAR